MSSHLQFLQPRTGVGTVLLAVLCAACSVDLQGPASVVSSAATESANTLLKSTHPDRPSEKPLREIGHVSDRFAGYYLDDQENLVVRMVGGVPDDAVNGMVRSALARAGRPLTRTNGQPMRIVVVPAEYSFETLARWRDTLFDNMPHDGGLASLDLNEGKNRIVIGYHSGGSSAALLRAAVQLGVHPGAIVLVQEDKLELTQSRTLMAAFSNVRGGVAWDRGANLPCTVAVTGILSGPGVLLRAALSASHCSNSWLSLDSGPFFQPLSPTQRGSEAVDHGRYVCGYLNLYHCAEADVSAYAIDAGTSTHGWIARPLQSRGETDPPNLTPTLINDADSIFALNGKYETFLQNDILHMIGRVSGWVWGPVKETCKDRWDGFDGFVCQDVVGVDGTHGDSGAPVILRVRTTLFLPVENKFAGIVWACTQPNCAGTDMFVSNTAQIQRQLGLTLSFQ